MRGGGGDGLASPPFAGDYGFLSHAARRQGRQAKRE